MSSSGVTYTIGGVKVEFPAKAYPSQISMMDKIIRGCSRAQNCLLESPTGSGKTLALLCGALAWQKAEKKKLEEVYAAEMMEYNHKREEAEKQKRLHLKVVQQTVCEDELSSGSAMEVDTATTVEVIELSDSEDDVFRQSKRVKVDAKVSVTKENPKTHSPIVPVAVVKAEEKEIKPPPKPRPPTIYFCTRTHKQVSQVINELRRTAYKNIKSTVLSSRTHSCINERGNDPRVNKTELCHTLLDPRTGMSCKFHKNVRNFRTFSTLESDGFPSLWELEDLVGFGKKKTVCPYYTARELMSEADIIFCPYNYLIDPLIRNSMNINLRGDIIIVDEAHNIEDSCREAASFSVLQDHITDSIHECEEILKSVKDSPKEQPCIAIINVLCAVSKWIDKHREQVVDMSEYDHGKFSMCGPLAVNSFKDYEFGPAFFTQFAENYAMLIADEKTIEESEMDEEFSSTIPGSTKRILEGLLLILSLLYNEQYTNDYHIVLTKEFGRQWSEAPEADDDGWFNRRKKTKTISQWRYSLNFWCFNPAATFTTIRQNARCIILSSGTLSPMNTFQSELGATFPITLEANHVIDPSQCWVASLGSGPNNVSLDGKYNSTNTYSFQDEIGNILLKICSFVPHGVLCFVPSYALLDKLYDRWANTGILDEISKHKHVLCEPRGGGDKLDELLLHFYEGIETTEDAVIGKEITGSLLLAVCRGKISEGLDFSDKNARMVVTIGIPYPHLKDNQIMLKKSYNDKYQHSKGLLSGSEWYQIQAYRALNQALGRCIRHRRDWGAILLIDDRFKNSSTYKSLSKWVRNKVTHHYSYAEMIDSLSSFMETRLKIEKQDS